MQAVLIQCFFWPTISQDSLSFIKKKRKVALCSDLQHNVALSARGAPLATPGEWRAQPIGPIAEVPQSRHPFPSGRRHRARTKQLCHICRMLHDYCSAYFPAISILKKKCGWLHTHVQYNKEKQNTIVTLNVYHIHNTKLVILKKYTYYGLTGHDNIVFCIYLPLLSNPILYPIISYPILSYPVYTSPSDDHFSNDQM